MDCSDTRAKKLAQIEGALAVIRPLYEALVASVKDAQDLKDDFLALQLVRTWCKQSGEEAVRVVLMLALLDLAEHKRKT